VAMGIPRDAGVAATALGAVAVSPWARPAHASEQRVTPWRGRRRKATRPAGAASAAPEQTQSATPWSTPVGPPIGDHQKSEHRVFAPVYAGPVPYQRDSTPDAANADQPTRRRIATRPPGSSRDSAPPVVIAPATGGGNRAPYPDRGYW